ncbi:MAG TPA: cyanophycinase [Gemmataceae bacterium]|nr:cyanophycinase [Gemmataceae bacterium]
MNRFLMCVLAGLMTVTTAGSGSLAGGHADDVFSQLSSSHGSRVGSLLLVGGGGLPDSIRQRFLELAGGREARIVIIPSASALPDAAEYAFTSWKTAAVKSVRVLHTTSRADADDPGFYGMLRDATGVWISGGDQSRLTTIFGGTAVERELANLLRRGGVVAGTSAGASVVTGVMMAEGGKAGHGFGLLANTIVDQHFSNRGRLPRLLGLLRSYPDQVGIGIDQETAVLIRGDEVSVLGKATVTVATPGGVRPSVRVYHAGSHFQPSVLSVASR